MKRMKKFASLALALVMALALAVPAFAAGNATITVENASKGETYKLVKLFNASYNETTKAIVYTGDIPGELSAYFEKEGEYIKATDVAMTDEGVLTSAAVEAITEWAKTQTGKEETADGGPLTFTGLDYGYYVVVSRTANGGAISVTSTMPNATIVDKNTNELTKPTKTVSNAAGDKIQTADVGETVTYTVSFKTLNWIDMDGEAKQVISYTVVDTLPDFLENVTVTEITVDGNKIPEQQFDDNKSMNIEWADKTDKLKCEDTTSEHTHGDGCYVWNSRYANGAELKITYTAVVTEEILNAEAGNHVNKVIVTPKTNDGPGDPQENEEDLYTATIVINKYAENQNNPEDQTAKLKGAKFVLKNSEGKYYYVDETTKKVTWVDTIEGATKVITDENGVAKFAGLKEDTYSLVETEAPAGYNKLTEDKEVVVTSEKNGNPQNIEANISLDINVPNNTGSVLPSTGGIGTTIFYVVGGILVAGAAILLVTRKRVEEQ